MFPAHFWLMNQAIPQSFCGHHRSRPAGDFPVAARIVLVAFFSMAICLASRAQLTTIAYDGFNYSAGPLAGQNGGTGWTSDWIMDYFPGSSLDVSASGMSYSGLSTSGGSVVWAPGGNGISEASRSLPLMDSGVVYVQFLSQFDSGSGGGTPNIRLSNSGSVTGGFGGNGGPTMSILDASLNAASDGSSSSSASLSDLNLVIGRIDYQDNDTEMWVNPDLETFDYQNPTSPDATYAGLAPAFNNIAIFTRDSANVDEIQVMAMPVPEPTAASLLMAVMGVWLFLKRLKLVFFPPRLCS